MDVVDVYETASGVDVLDQAVKRKEYQSAVEALAIRTEETVASTRFPQVRSTGRELLAAAKEVLARPGYDVYPISRMEITYDKQTKSTAEGEIDWGAAATPVTVTGYKWDEFAVTTAENVNGKYFLYYNLFKYFHKGGTDVPTGKWTLGERWKSKRILAENIDQ